MNIIKKITFEEVMSKISEEEIYRHYMPYEFKLNVLTKNPFTTKDNKPSFIIGTKYGKITHFAFNSNNKGDCINFVMQMFGLDYKDAINKIINDFSGNIENLPKIIKPAIQHIKNYSIIQVITKPFTEQDLNFWKEYYQGLEDLKRENIFSVKKVFVDKERMLMYENNMTFGYFYPEIERWKIYSPYNKKEFKWRSNVPFDNIEHLDKIQNCKNVFISKSKKDRMVLVKALGTENIITTQGESPACFSNDTIQYLKEHSENQITVFDADKTGKQNSMYLTETYGFRHCNVPDFYLEKGINDFADVCKNYGLLKVTKHFKQKKLI